MKITPALAALALLSLSPAASAQEFKLPPDRGSIDYARTMTCQELDREIAKTRKYITIVQSESRVASDGSPTAPNMSLAEGGLARGGDAAQANDRLNQLEAIHRDKMCPPEQRRR